MLPLPSRATIGLSRDILPIAWMELFLPRCNLLYSIFTAGYRRSGIASGLTVSRRVPKYSGVLKLVLS